ncbi:type II secretion system protein GspM [Pseudomonas urmiensis]|jgi:type II secretion system protein M (XcpZ-type)|uniref:type II secretion system protein GspM n=1 Tax=Pseudomonas urmiensis TaxID=2745493 RepID=UPI003D0B7A4F
MNRELLQHYRMPFAWALIAMLVLSLAVREGLAQWRELAQWQALAESAASLRDAPPMGLDRLRQSAQARQISLQEIDSNEGVWQLRGQVSDEKTLQQWLLALQAEGAQPLQWALEQGDQGLRFDVQVQP